MAGCNTLLGINGDDAPETDGGGGAEGGLAADGAANRDSANDPDVGEPLTGTDGAADDGAPISADASADVFVPPGCPGNADCVRVVFVTSAAVDYTGATVSSADGKCTSLAAAAALPRIRGRAFQAWVSDDSASEPAKRFVHGAAPYIRPDGTIIASNWQQLVSGSLSNTIFHDENGIGVAAAAHAWTGTAADGTFSAPNCDGWSLDVGTARIGIIGAKNANWTSFATPDPCKTTFRRLYCFEK